MSISWRNYRRSLGSIPKRPHGGMLSEYTDKAVLTLPMLRLISSKVQGRKGV